MKQNRRTFVKIIGGAGVLCVINPTSAFASENKLLKLTVLHSNDVHSQIDAFSATHPKFPGMGGFARRAALIEKVRQEEKNVLLLDAGDIFQGSPYFNFFKGELEIKLMNRMRYDAMTIGNHEFDNGADELFKQLKKADFPIICANYKFENPSQASRVKPYIIKKYGRLKVGVFGISIKPDGLISPNNFRDIKYVDEVKVANEIAATLKREEACDLVIALTHLGIQADISLAKETNNIDLIIGGHSHTFLEEPMIVKNNEGKDVLINQMGWAGVYLGRLDFYFKAGNTKIESNRL